MQTRRQFLAQATAASLVGWRLHAQAAQLGSIPGPEVGEVTTSLALRNVTVIDCTGKPAQPSMTVMIVDNRIQSVQPTSGEKLTGDVRTTDASGKFLIPGLWDMHTHLEKRTKLAAVYRQRCHGNPPDGFSPPDAFRTAV